MSSKKAKLDLIVRQRYQNPIPPPAFPPLLVDIPVRLPLLIGKPDLVSEYAASLPLPMMIDSEIGMPLDLNAFGGMWTAETRGNPNLNPPRPTKTVAGKQQPQASPDAAALDPEDAALLEPPARSTILNGVVSSANYVQAGSLKQTYHKPEVAWLRNTTYLSRDTGKKVGGAGAGAGVSANGRSGERKGAGAGQVVVDDSMVAQQQAIEKTFWFHDHTRVEEMRHPLKPHLRAVDAFDLFPDEDAVKLNLNVVNFSERPAGSQAQRLSETELETSIMRPRKLDHFKGFNFYVVEDRVAQAPMPDEDHSDDSEASGEEKAKTKTVEAGQNGLDKWFEVRKEVLPPDEDEERNREDPTWKTIKMGRVRDYEITKRDEPNEIVLTFFDETDPVDPVVEYEAAKKRRENASAGDAGVNEVKEEQEDADDKDEDEDDDDDDLFGDEELAQEANGEKDPVSSTKDAVAEPLSTMTKRKAPGVYYGKIVSRVHVRKRRMMRTNDDLEDDDLWDNIILAYEAPNARKRARFDDIAKMFDPAWIERELARGNEEVVGDALDERADGYVSEAAAEEEEEE
ncbi:hypothetical protein NliqN6_4975 [Naganishia liquefaciens]|uniref:Uncharacterized protein n=1 Tax=Naganishia liquefaciens TaxID=104408 RepID=A0A8H3TWV9_9TREE|nr:hypothetical protein NliqN6_4975 [Naganishia liquefaciens]